MVQSSAPKTRGFCITLAVMSTIIRRVDVKSWGYLSSDQLTMVIGFIHPGRLTWTIIMEVWKIIFLSKWVICRFHVNLPGWIGDYTTKIYWDHNFCHYKEPYEPISVTEWGFWTLLNWVFESQKTLQDCCEILTCEQSKTLGSNNNNSNNNNNNNNNNNKRQKRYPLPETHIAKHLKIGGWKTILSFWEGGQSSGA